MWRLNQFLAWRAGVGPATAANLVAAAERADELPQAIDAVRRGELSLDQLMPIVRHVPAWADLQATSLAVRLTVNQIRRLVRATDWDWAPGAPVAADDEPAAEEQAAEEPVVEGTVVESESSEGSDNDREAPIEAEPALNRVSYGTGPDGRWYLHADLDADLGESFETALDEARDSVFARLNTRSETDDPTVRVVHPVSDVDGLVELAQRSLATVTEPTRRSRYRVSLHLNINGSITTSNGTSLPDSIARLITCDGSIDPIFVEAGIPISVGRTQRTIPDRTRRTVMKRDNSCCQVPGCAATRGLEIHHIIHWTDDGPTDTWNLLTVCSRHHRLHHKHRLGISGNADQPNSMTFTDSRGNPITPSGAFPISPNSPPTTIRGTYEHPYGERLDSRWVTFTDPAHPHRNPHAHPPDGDSHIAS